MESPILMQEAIDAGRARTAEYLARIAASNDLAGIEVQTELHAGMPAEMILSVARSQHIDVIIMCSHGDTGFKRWALGSVAQKVARHSSIPVLVLREHAGVPTNLHPEGTRPVRVLVALDGSALAEAALTPAAYLSVALSAPGQGALHLAQILHLPTRYEYGQTDSLAKAKQQGTVDANAYLRTIEQRLREGDLAHLNLLLAGNSSFPT
jgi:hypothetical protein